MGRRGQRQGGPSAHVFVRPLVMLAFGLAAAVVMWRVLMRGTFEAAAGPPSSLAEAVGIDTTGR